MPEKTRKLSWSKKFNNLPSYFDYIFVHLKQTARLRPKLSPKVLSTLDSNPARTRTRPEKPGPTYNSAQARQFCGVCLDFEATNGFNF